MIYVLLYLGGTIILLMGIYYLLNTFHAYREAMAKQKKLQWAVEQMERAIDQINSHDQDVIIAGLQTLSMLNVPDLRLRALPRLKELTQNSNELIARHAQANMSKVAHEATIVK